MIDIDNYTEPKANTESKYWVFTLFNYTDEIEIYLSGLVAADICSFISYGREICPDTNRAHLQGYIEFSKKKRFSYLRNNILTFDCYVAQREGNADQAREYTEKEGNYFTDGICSKSVQGKRTDIIKACELILNGGTKRELALEFPGVFVKYHKGLDEFKHVVQVSYETTPYTEVRFAVTPDWTKTQIFTGPSGCGKTVYALQLLPRALFITHLDSLKLYNSDDYDGIIFDEGSFRHLPRESQIHLVDNAQDRDIHIRYQVARIPKGTKKIITTNSGPRDILLYEDGAIARRVEVHEF